MYRKKALLTLSRFDIFNYLYDTKSIYLALNINYDTISLIITTATICNFCFKNDCF